MMRVAIPSNAPGGLDAKRSEHFGHCDLFTVINLDGNNGITGVEMVENSGHEAGGCLVPVKILQDAKVDAIVVGGMGARPMMGFSEVGITVYYADPNRIPDVGLAVENLTAGNLPVMRSDQACSGSGNCHH
jgi:predicted Fe-Mo cluster-binding NifX family protein